MKRLAALWLCAAAAAHAAVLDDLRDSTPWRASASDQVQASLQRDADGSLCLHADFNGVSGYAVMRRELALDWPANFELTLRAKGGGAVNDVQIKFVDDTGENVWWINRPSFRAPAALAELKFKRRHVDFAWGPAADRRLVHTRYVEFVIAAGREGGRSTLCLASMALQPRAVDPAVWPAPRSSSGKDGLTVDFGLAREFNGVVLHWPAGVAAIDYELQASDDARQWRTLRRVMGSDGGLDALFLPESESRWLRVVAPRGTPLPALELRSALDWPDFNAVLKTLAAVLPRGQMPRAFLGEQNYWTLVGVDGGGARSGLISEDGAIEVGRGGYSVEPVLRLDDGRFVTWADVERTQSLREGHLPLPTVSWRHADFTLDIEAAADGPRDAPELLARYVLRNTGERARSFTFMLVLRPWQVNPPQQFLTTPGGAVEISALAWDGRALAVQGRAPLVPTLAPQRISALAFDGGLGLVELAAAPALKSRADAQQHPSASLQFSITLAPGASQTIGWVAPLASRKALPPGNLDARFEAAATFWRLRLDRITLDAGAEAAPLIATLRSTLAQILMSRDGAALRPGTRSYARTWVRDGAMMTAALVRLGEIEAAREFVDAFAERIFDSGKVPCCVDARGADPVVENDSAGEYLFAVAEVWRHTHDASWLARHGPRVQRVVAYLETLRQSQRGENNRKPERANLFGLLPPSISHEGYSDRPAYSYWDDFWGLRGYKDAVQIAMALGHDDEATRWAGWRDEFEHEFMASLVATAERGHNTLIAGAADRGDFDPTSSTVALDPAQATIPAPLLEASFERYWQESLARAEGQRAWKDYTPYELRTVGAFVRLGQPGRAHAMLDFFFRHQRPPGWNQWAEVVLPDAREPHFLGDMPHAWVASDYLRSALDCFAWEREADGALVLGAGWKPEWLARGVTVRGLSTSRGHLAYRLQRTPQGWSFELADPGAGPVRLAWPGHGPLPAATHEGRSLAWDGRELVLPDAAATVLIADTPTAPP